MTKRVLITGITGFAGSHMAEFLLEKGLEVFGVCRWRANRENINHLHNKIKLIEADLLDAHSLESLMFEVRPDLIFHLAAQSFVAASWTSPAVTLETNVVGPANLFEAVRRAQIDPVIQIACCYDERTKAFTSKGLKHFTELKKGDLILSIDPKTREVSFKPISKIIIDDYKGETIHIKGKKSRFNGNP